MITVIIPVYNVEKYLKECVESVLNQTYKDLEIILIDDGSNDGSGEICDEYAKIDERIKVIHKENAGLSSARNAGIEIAHGEYYTFIDSDDYIADDMAEQLLYALESTNADISVCGMTSNEYNIENGIAVKNICYTKQKTLKLILTEKMETTACGKLYRRELFEHIRYPEGKIYEDLGTTYKLVEASSEIAYTAAKKYYYRTNPESITKVNFTNKNLDYFDIAEELQTYIKEHYPQYMKYAKNHSVRISISFMRKISICGFNDEKTIDFLVSNIRKNIFGYLFGGYSIFSKMYGVWICINTKSALRFFNKKRGEK